MLTRLNDLNSFMCSSHNRKMAAGGNGTKGLPGLDKIKKFRDRSLNFSKLSVKQNLRQKVQNL